MLFRGAKLLILDEPTGVLTLPEKEKLFETLRNFSRGGYSVIFISHKLDEVMEISDRVTVLRGGRKVATENTRDMDKQSLARLMVGRKRRIHGAERRSRPANPAGARRQKPARAGQPPDLLAQGA